jgi:hypothetical protein
MVGINLCYILIDQPAILDFALGDDINRHSIILRALLHYASPPNYNSTKQLFRLPKEIEICRGNSLDAFRDEPVASSIG